MRILRDYLDSGKPLIGIRTASHAFNANLVAPKAGGDPVPADKVLPADLDQWKTFDRDVLACSYHGHHGAGTATVVTVNPDKKRHPVLTGLRPAARTVPITPLWRPPIGR